jgi:drug/metabolite transporter (DMT)-like permease
LTANFLSCGRALFCVLWGLPLAAALYFLIGMPFTMQFSRGALAVLLFMGVLRYAVGNALWYRAIRNMHLSKATALVLVYPVFTYLFSVILKFDKVTLYQTAGLLLALLGAYLVHGTIKGGAKK